LIEASVDGLITVDPSGGISDVNEQMCRMSGYSREELTGTPFSDYFQDAALATAGVKETFEKGVVTDYVLTLARRSGTPLRSRSTRRFSRTPREMSAESSLPPATSPNRRACNPSSARSAPTTAD